MIQPAHSMDTAFYAITKDRELIQFYTSENGVVPEGFPVEQELPWLPDLITRNYTATTDPQVEFVYYYRTSDIFWGSDSATLQALQANKCDLKGNIYFYIHSPHLQEKPVVVPRELAHSLPQIELHETYIFDPDCVARHWNEKYCADIIYMALRALPSLLQLRLFSAYHLWYRPTKLDAETILHNGVAVISIPSKDLKSVAYILKLSRDLVLLNVTFLEYSKTLLLITEDEYKLAPKAINWVIMRYKAELLNIPAFEKLLIGR